MPFPFDLNEKYSAEDDGHDDNLKRMTYAHRVIEHFTSDNLTDSSSLVTLQTFSDDLTVRANPFRGIDFYHGSEKVLSVYRTSDF